MSATTKATSCIIIVHTELPNQQHTQMHIFDVILCCCAQFVMHNMNKDLESANCRRDSTRDVSRLI